MPAFKESDGKPAFPSAEDLHALRQGKTAVKCRVQVCEPLATWATYAAASSFEGCPPQYTYKHDRSNGVPPVDVTIKLSPL